MQRRVRAGGGPRGWSGSGAPPRRNEGKERMKQVGSVEIPQDAFLAILKID